MCLGLDLTRRERSEVLVIRTMATCRHGGHTAHRGSTGQGPRLKGDLRKRESPSRAPKGKGEQAGNREGRELMEGRRHREGASGASNPGVLELTRGVGATEQGHWRKSMGSRAEEWHLCALGDREGFVLGGEGHR